MALNAPTESVARLAADDPDKDLPLRDDIRLLGRILGDTVREQEGEEVFELVEQIRKASIRFHRDNEVGARRELEATLDSLNADQTLSIVRAYSYFSHLVRWLTPSNARARWASSPRRSASSSIGRWSARC
jgi:phosphoenolpyruvate carboxylase